MTNYFQLYGLAPTFAPNAAAVKAKYYELSRLHHPDRYAQGGDTAEMAEALRMAADNNHAYKTLRSPDATMAYMLQLHGMLEADEKYALPPAFLMEMMDLNEAISDYEDQPDNHALKQQATTSLTAQLQQWETDTATLTAAYDPAKDNTTLLQQIKDHYFRKKYLLRIQERIDKFAAL